MLADLPIGLPHLQTGKNTFVIFSVQGTPPKCPIANCKDPVSENTGCRSPAKAGAMLVATLRWRSWRISSMEGMVEKVVPQLGKDIGEGIRKAHEPAPKRRSSVIDTSNVGTLHVNRENGPLSEFNGLKMGITLCPQPHVTSPSGPS
jgi:hypothetical protein